MNFNRNIINFVHTGTVTDCIYKDFVYFQEESKMDRELDKLAQLKERDRQRLVRDLRQGNHFGGIMNNFP